MWHVLAGRPKSPERDLLRFSWDQLSGALLMGGRGKDGPSGSPLQRPLRTECLSLSGWYLLVSSILCEKIRTISLEMLSQIEIMFQETPIIILNLSFKFASENVLRSSLK
jgi:hypothetical protein